MQQLCDLIQNGVFLLFPVSCITAESSFFRLQIPVAVNTHWLSPREKMIEQGSILEDIQALGHKSSIGLEKEPLEIQ